MRVTIVAQCSVDSMWLRTLQVSHASAPWCSCRFSTACVTFSSRHIPKEIYCILSRWIFRSRRDDHFDERSMTNVLRNTILWYQLVRTALPMLLPWLGKSQSRQIMTRLLTGLGRGIDIFSELEPMLWSYTLALYIVFTCADMLSQDLSISSDTLRWSGIISYNNTQGDILGARSSWYDLPSPSNTVRFEP